MGSRSRRTICWVPLWNEERPRVGMELLLLTERTADSVVLALDDERGPFRLAYTLTLGRRLAAA